MADAQRPGAIPPEPPYQTSSTPAQSVPPAGYTPVQYGPAATTNATTASAQGMSDTAAGTVAYITIIPAIIFLVMPPYNTRPFVKFHCFQCFGLAVIGFCLGILSVIPIIGWIISIFGSLGLLILWLICLVKASQGSYLKLPYISEFAAKQSGYTPGLL